MSGVRLTKKNNGSWGLPVVEELRTNKQVVDEDGTPHPGNIWRLWSDAELGNIGLAHVDDVTKVPAGKEKTGTFTDKYTAKRIKRTYALQDRSGAKLKRAMLSSVKTMRQSMINAGIVATVKTSDYILQTDAESRELITGATAAANSGHTFPASFAWRMRDNTDVKLTPALMKKMGQDVFDHVNNCHEAARAHLTAIDALSTWGELTAYDLSTLWPPTAPPEDE
jgi:hypothetical protein